MAGGFHRPPRPGDVERALFRAAAQNRRAVPAIGININPTTQTVVTSAAVVSMGPLVDAAVPGTFPTPPTSSTWVTMQTGFVYRAQPRVRLDVLVSSPDVSTTGNVQLVDAAGNVIGTIPVAANTSSYQTLGPVAWPAGTWTPFDGMYLSLQAQRTAGTGTIGVRCTGLWGVQ